VQAEQEQTLFRKLQFKSGDRVRLPDCKFALVQLAVKASQFISNLGLEDLLNNVN